MDFSFIIDSFWISLPESILFLLQYLSYVAATIAPELPIPNP